MTTSETTAHVLQIGIPVRNGADFAADARVGARSDHPNLTVHVSENASTDEIADICREFAERDSRVTFTTQPVESRTDEEQPLPS